MTFSGARWLTMPVARAERRRWRPVPVAEIIALQKELAAARKRIAKLEAQAKRAKAKPSSHHSGLAHRHDISRRQGNPPRPPAAPAGSARAPAVPARHKPVEPCEGPAVTRTRSPTLSPGGSSTRPLISRARSSAMMAIGDTRGLAPSMHQARDPGAPAGRVPLALDHDEGIARKQRPRRLDHPAAHDPTLADSRQIRRRSR